MSDIMTPVMDRVPHTIGMLLVGFALTACATASDSPPPDQTIPFAEIKSTPESFKGQPIVLGGQVLNAKRLKDGTRIEVLQLPLTSSNAPVIDLTQSQGRFIAIQREFLDPATIPHGTHLTVTGEVTGSITLPLDETEYNYPVIEVKNLNVWPPMADASQYQVPPYPYAYPYGRPFWGPYWRPYPYW
ncbi:MAG TPA: Slp family lipoprotein [Nitrospiraceae bacterium]|jgi:outer membrane lipoprotein|nr:Slp family lipoprotein [Nitrospiraceae bacterium]